MESSQATAATGDRAAELLLLAVDAGGTKTSAWITAGHSADNPAILGRGRASSGNPLSVGFEEATRAILEAIEQARRQAGRPTARVDRGVLSVAGAADVGVRDQFLNWARTKDLAERVTVVTDVLPVLAAGTDDCCGVALVVGTGSVAFARDRGGRTARCGGWGYLVGDDGSGYAIGRAAVRHALEHLETKGGTNPLAERVLNALNAKSVAAATASIYQSAHPRATVAALAQMVTKLAADDDDVSRAIVQAAARDLAQLAARAARAVDLGDRPLPVAVAGGVIFHSPLLRGQLHAELETLQLQCELRIVEQPLAGCVRIATHEFAGLDLAWR